jgi:hypothetical protein
MTDPRPITPDVIEYALTLATRLRDDGRDLPDAAVRDLDELNEAFVQSGIRNWPAQSTEQWGAHHLFGMRLLVDAAVPPGVIEFRPALRLPL